ncbi:MAG TPA: hypothetical protein VHD63_11885 [Ktedonobacteraceae bacterium]|nr:hypothetical protein [Ktedonobacteraceae bacterium]
MPTDFNWQQAVHDPRFWALRYGCSKYDPFPGVAPEEVSQYIEEQDFLNLAILDEDPLAGYVGEGDDPQLAEIEVGSRRLVLPFPEGYSWLMDFAAEDGENLTGIYHELFHPEMDPMGYLHPTSRGLALAEESGHERLPGLRWAELKQIEACLRHQSFALFDLQAIVPLLYFIVNPVSFDEYDEVCHTLAGCWQGLRVLDAVQADQWLSHYVTVYHQGQEWWRDEQKEWHSWRAYAPSAQSRTLWTHSEENGWQTINESSYRHTREDGHPFLPFFSMLQRFS